MKISELQPRQGGVNVELDIVDKEQPREFEKFGKTGRVCNATAKDESGTIKLTLWNEQIDQINAGDKVKMENGYVGEWQGELQLSTGKFGKLEVVSGGVAAPAAAEPAEQPKKLDGSVSDPTVEEEDLDD